MKHFKNDLGWYFIGFEIRRKCPSKKALLKHIIEKIIFVVIALLIYCAAMIAKGISLIDAFFMIIFPFLIIAIFGLLSKFWLLRIISIQPRTSSLIIYNVHINKRDQRLPCHLFSAQIDYDSESGLYRVYLRPSEFLIIEGPSEDFNHLVWETTNEQEAAQIVEELRQCDVGETDTEKMHPIIPGNKKIGIAFLVCWILCLFAVMFYIKKSLQPEISNPDSTESSLILIKAVVIFGLLSVIVYAGYNIWFGLMAIKDCQIPSPRTIFFGEMRLFQGDIAVKRGRKIVAFGIAAIIISLIAAIYLDYKLKEMIPSQNNQQTSTTNQNL